jgi:dinuclear metal center YbgI/SA1388 family protein
MKIAQIIAAIEEFAPLQLQEAYDNAGLIIGNASDEVQAALITLDVTDAVVQEAIDCHCNLIIAHHPLIFKGIKRIGNDTLVGRLVTKCIQNNIAVYAAHTNLDNVKEGVNRIIADRIGLHNTRILAPMSQQLRKLVTFCPSAHADEVRAALFAAGAGHIGNYDSCSFSAEGRGSFRAGEGTTPFIGKIGELHFEAEERIEAVIPAVRQSKIVAALLQSHPYEEVAYDIYTLENQFGGTGAGLIGELETPEEIMTFLKRLKKTFGADGIRYTPIVDEKVTRIAVCGGSGSFLIHQAVRAGAQVFVTGDVKYHDFFEADGHLLIADIGHYESEQFTKELLMNIIKKKNSNFAVQISGANTNPVHYL